jgi:hypothetical protein
VNPHPVRPQVTEERATSLLGAIIDMGEKTAVKVISIDEVHATPEVAEALQIQVGDPVVKIVRVRHYRNRPLSHITVYLPIDLGRSLTRKDLENTPMLRLLEAAGVELGRASQVLTARLADVVVAPLLDVPVGGALLAVRRVVLDKAASGATADGPVSSRPLRIPHGTVADGRRGQRQRVGGKRNPHGPARLTCGRGRNPLPRTGHATTESGDTAHSTSQPRSFRHASRSPGRASACP